MLIALLQPLLAAVEFTGIMCVATIVMMFVGWILNLVNAKNRPAQAARHSPARPGDDRLQSEIDSFLQEVGGGRRRVEPRELEIDGDELEIEIVGEGQPVRRRRRRRPQSLPAQPDKPKHVPLSERHLQSSAGSRHLSTNLQDHVEEYMDDRFVTQDDVSGGGGTPGNERASSGRADPQSISRSLSGGIVNLLRNPATVRQAILISEILSPPKSRRK